MIATASSTSDVRRKFYDAARKMYPNVGEPGTVWVLTQVLGWDWGRITKTAVDGFGRDGYRVFVLDSEGQRIFDPTADNGIGGPKVVTRKWTNEEKRALKDWWWLLGL